MFYSFAENIILLLFLLKLFQPFIIWLFSICIEWFFFTASSASESPAAICPPSLDLEEAPSDVGSSLLSLQSKNYLHLKQYAQRNKIWFFPNTQYFHVFLSLSGSIQSRQCKQESRNSNNVSITKHTGRQPLKFVFLVATKNATFEIHIE